MAPPIEAKSTSEPKVLAKENEREIEVPVSSDALMALNRSEISEQVATAKAYPRTLSVFRAMAQELVTQDKEAAALCIYALPRGKEQNAQGRWEQKIIKGPSARLAEILLYCWGNMRANARVVAEDERFVTAMGCAIDLQQNTAVAYEVRRRITDSNGRRYSDDMITQTANAACSIAFRNAVLKVIPQPLWKGIYLAAEQTIAGDRKTLVDRRQAIFDQFKAHRITPSMACQLVGAAGTADVGQEQIVALQGMLTSLKDGDTTVEALLAEIQEGQAPEKPPKKDKLTEQLEGSLAMTDEVKAAQAKLEQKKAANTEHGPQKVSEIKSPTFKQEDW